MFEFCVIFSQIYLIVFLLSSQHMHILCLQKLGSWPLETWERFFWKLSRLDMSQLVLNKLQNHAAIFNNMANIINNSWKKNKRNECLMSTKTFLILGKR